MRVIAVITVPLAVLATVSVPANAAQDNNTTQQQRLEKALAAGTKFPATVRTPAVEPKRETATTATAKPEPTAVAAAPPLPAAAAAAMAPATPAVTSAAPAVVIVPPVKNAAAPAKVATETKDAKAPVATPATRTVPAPAAKKAEPVRKVQKPKTDRLVASIDLSSQRMTVRVDGAVKHVWPISSGRSGYKTPTGTWKPYRMHTMWYSRKYDDAPMPHAVFFHGGYAVHATYATSRLGRPASHGCIRLSPSNARQFFNLVMTYSRAQTRIAISGSTPDYSPRYTKRRSRPARVVRRQYDRRYNAPPQYRRTYRQAPQAYAGGGFLGGLFN